MTSDLTLACRIALGVYAALLAAGGVMGYVKAGSRPSLIAGVLSALAAAVALGLSFPYPPVGFGVALALAVVMAAFFLRRWNKTGKFMPAAMLAMLSAIVAGMMLTQVLG